MNRSHGAQVADYLLGNPVDDLRIETHSLLGKNGMLPLNGFENHRHHHGDNLLQRLVSVEILRELTELTVLVLKMVHL